MNEWTYHPFVFSSPMAFFSARDGVYLTSETSSDLGSKVSLAPEVISLWVSLGVVLLSCVLELCSSGLWGQNPGLRTRLLHEPSGHRSYSAYVLCLRITCKNKVSSCSFKWSPLLSLQPKTCIHADTHTSHTFLGTPLWKASRWPLMDFLLACSLLPASLVSPKWPISGLWIDPMLIVFLECGLFLEILVFSSFSGWTFPHYQLL